MIKKIVFFVSAILSFYLPVCAWITVSISSDTIAAVTDRYWIGSTNTDWNNTGNWSNTSGGATGEAVPDSTCDVFFDGNGLGNHCIVNVPKIKCKSITAVAGFTKKFSVNSDSVELWGSFSWDAVDTLTTTGRWHWNADGDFHIGTGVVLVVPDNTYFIHPHSCVWDVDETLVYFVGLTGPESGKTFNFTGSGTFYLNEGQLICNGGTINNSTGSLTFRCTAQTTPLVINSATTFQQSSTNGIQCNIYGKIKVNWPAASIPYLTFQSQNTSGTGNCTLSVAGNISYSTLTIKKNSTGTFVFNTNNNNILRTSLTASTVIGNANATNSLIINNGSSKWEFGAYDGNTNNVGTTTINMGTGDWRFCYNSIVFGSNTRINGGSTSTFLFDSTSSANTTFTPQRLDTMPAITLNRSNVSANVSLGDTLKCKKLILTDGKLRGNSRHITVYDSTIINSTDSSIFNKPLTTNTLNIGASTLPVWQTGSEIIITSCNTIVNNSGVSLPTTTYPATGPISYDSANVHYVTGSPIATLAVTNSGCGGTFTKDTLPPGLSLNPSTGAITGTPTNIDTLQSIITLTGAGGTTKDTIVFNIISACGAVNITNQPAPITVTEPAPAIFAVIATGDPVLSYQWQKNSSDVSGATNSAYITPATAVSQDGDKYRCVISNSCGSATSDEAVLTVLCDTLSIVAQPASTSALAPATANFTVGVIGGAPISYQWQKGTTNISGATNSSYTTPATSRADTNSTYRVIVSNSCGVDTSDAATLTLAGYISLTSNRPEYSKLAGGGQDTVTGVNMDWIDSLWVGDSVIAPAGITKTTTRAIFTLPAYHQRGGVDIVAKGAFNRDTVFGLSYKNLHVDSMVPPQGRAGDTVRVSAIWGLGTTGLSCKFDTSTAAVVAGYNDTSARVVAPVHANGTVQVIFINGAGDTTYTGWKYGIGAKQRRFSWGWDLGF